jgi:hypothetical protein
LGRRDVSACGPEAKGTALVAPERHRWRLLAFFPGEQHLPNRAWTLPVH